MDIMSIKINREDTGNLYQTPMVSAPDKKEGKVSENGIINATDLAQKRNADFLGERQTENGREELRIKTRAYTQDMQAEKKIAQSESNLSQNVDRLNEADRLSADIEAQKAFVMEQSEDDANISIDDRDDMLADLDARLQEIQASKTEAENGQFELVAKAREDRIANNESANMVEANREERNQSTEELRSNAKNATVDMMERIQEETKANREEALKKAEAAEDNKKEETVITQPERPIARDNASDQAQARVQEELLNMVGNLRIASEDAKGLSYSSTI